MAYKTDGSPHLNGITGENLVLEFFNNPENYDFLCKSLKKILKRENYKKFNFEHKGGTTQRSDIYDSSNNVRISIKSKKYDNNKYKGTFDLINTSKILDYIEKNNEKSIIAIENYKNYLKNSQDKSKEINETKFRQEIKNHLVKMFNSLNGSVTNLLFQTIIDVEKNVIDVIRDYKNNVNETINKSDIHFLKKNWIDQEFEKIDINQQFNTNKKSEFILNKDGTKSCFRFRVELNNGISALMANLNLKPKTKGKNAHSSLTFKIQVDKVKEIVDRYDVNKSLK